MRNPRIVLPYTLSLLALLCMVAMLAKQHPDRGARYDVRIVNGFTDNSSLPLVIWCGSEDADMGGRALQEGDDYSWTLETASSWDPLLTWIWREEADSGRIRSNVHCTMKWDSRRRKFYAFLGSRDTQRCRPLRMCLWLVKEDGFYFSSDGYYYHKEFTWP